MIFPYIDQPWVDDAACKKRHPDNFFPARTSSPNEAKEVARRAKAICATCPVREQCLEHALEYEPFGVWGGMTPDERVEERKIRRVAGQVYRKPRPREQGCGTDAGYKWHRRRGEEACGLCREAQRQARALRDGHSRKAS